MRTAFRIAALIVSASGVPALAFAQRVTFERTIESSAAMTLEVSTDRGKIEVVAGPAGRVLVEGAATVRVGWNVPPNAVEIARQVAASPPIEQAGNTVKLTIPAARDAQRAVTVSYRVQVPPDTTVRTTSGSGATSIRGVAAPVDVRTQSAAIDVGDVSGAVQIATGSGAVRASDIAGTLSVTTSSSSFDGSRLRSSLRVRTQSGDVDAALEGRGDVDVETSSSGVQLRGVRGGLLVKTQSGRVTLQGVPAGDWSATTSSSSVTIELEQGPGFRLDAASRSGSVTLERTSLAGSITERAAKGSVGSGGPLVQVRTGSGSIRVQGAER
jgi:DUF4097 and DUF4098 domain-containing protein YvlB